MPSLVMGSGSQGRSSRTYYTSVIFYPLHAHLEYRNWDEVKLIKSYYLSCPAWIERYTKLKIFEASFESRNGRQQEPNLFNCIQGVFPLAISKQTWEKKESWNVCLARDPSVTRFKILGIKYKKTSRVTLWDLAYPFDSFRFV